MGKQDDQHTTSDDEDTKPPADTARTYHSSNSTPEPKDTIRRWRDPSTQNVAAQVTGSTSSWDDIHMMKLVAQRSSDDSFDFDQANASGNQKGQENLNNTIGSGGDEGMEDCLMEYDSAQAQATTTTTTTTTPNRDAKQPRNPGEAAITPGAYAKAPGSDLKRNRAARYSVIARDEERNYHDTNSYDSGNGNTEGDGSNNSEAQEKQGHKSGNYEKSATNCNKEEGETNSIVTTTRNDSEQDRELAMMRKATLGQLGLISQTDSTKIDEDNARHSLIDDEGDDWHNLQLPTKATMEAAERQDGGDYLIDTLQHNVSPFPSASTGAQDLEQEHPYSAPKDTDDFMVEAHLVTEDDQGNKSDETFYVAHQVSSRDILLDSIKSPQGILAVAGCLLLLIAIITGSVLGAQATAKDGNGGTAAPSVAPSETPTQAPTIEFSSNLLPVYTMQAIANNPTSPQALSLNWVLDDPYLQEIPTDRKLKRFALATIYHATNGAEWLYSDNWLSHEHHECEWYGAVPQLDGGCNQYQSVDGLDLDKNLLVGNIPAELGMLEGLKTLDFSDNALESTIPTTIGLLSSLVSVRLDRNLLEEGMPSEIGQLTLLKVLALSHNKLFGSLISEIGFLQELKHLFLDSNTFYGPLPSGIRNLSKIETINFNDNLLSGYPPCAGNVLTSLRTVEIRGNRMFGTLCSQLGLLPAMLALDLSDSFIDGTLPSELGNWPALSSLRLSNNRLTGSIPSELFRLTRLNKLDLSGCQITGSIPTQLGGLSVLRELKLQYNQLTSSMPSEVKTLPKLTVVDISGNLITGTIPTEAGALGRLESMALDFNSMSGKIPSEIFSNSKLQYFSCQYNTISGTMPSELGLAGGLISLNVGNMKSLEGTIPTEIGLLTRLESFAASSCSLQGEMPSEIGNLKVLQVLSVLANKLSGTLTTALGSLHNLVDFFGQQNFWTGLLPSELGSLAFLQRLNLQGDSSPSNSAAVGLSGKIPTTLGRMTSLSYLNLGSHHFSGFLPSELGLLSNLGSALLRQNNLQGSIPSEMLRLNNLDLLDLRENDGLTGSVPASFCDQDPFTIHINCSNVACSCCKCD